MTVLLLSFNFHLDLVTKSFILFVGSVTEPSALHDITRKYDEFEGSGSGRPQLNKAVSLKFAWKDWG
jgi:hypothetical protein